MTVSYLYIDYILVFLLYYLNSFPSNVPLMFSFGWRWSSALQAGYFSLDRLRLCHVLSVIIVLGSKCLQYCSANIDLCAKFNSNIELLSPMESYNTVTACQCTLYQVLCIDALFGLCKISNVVTKFGV